MTVAWVVEPLLRRMRASYPQVSNIGQLRPMQHD
jgi:hypothetical protein